MILCGVAVAGWQTEQRLRPDRLYNTSGEPVFTGGEPDSCLHPIEKEVRAGITATAVISSA